MPAIPKPMKRRWNDAPIDISVDDVLRRNTAVVTVRLTGMKEFRFRLWVAARLIRLAAWISKDVVRIDNG